MQYFNAALEGFLLARDVSRYVKRGVSASGDSMRRQAARCIRLYRKAHPVNWGK